MRAKTPRNPTPPTQRPKPPARAVSDRDLDVRSTPLEDSLETARILVPEIRDYERINLEIVARLQTGFKTIVLQGVEGQRLLVSGLSGDWEGCVVVEGRAGPDLGAGLNTPRLRVDCLGDVADGVGHSLRGGSICVRGNAGTCAGYGLSGGRIIIEGNTGPRAGLNQKGGLLVVFGNAGNLVGEGRAGGIFAAFAGRIGKHPNLAATGGRFLNLELSGEMSFEGLDPEMIASLSEAISARRASDEPAARGATPT